MRRIPSEQIYFYCRIRTFLSGCAASVDTYVVPAPNSNPQPLSSIAGNFHRDSFYAWQKSELLSIDNKVVSFGFFDGIDAKIPVVPGEHAIVSKVTVNRGFANGPYQAIVEVKAFLRPGVDYQLKGIINGAKINSWVEANGKRNSAIFSTPYQSVPMDNMVFMPIVVK